ncbi:MAG: amino acid ABC transporter substrate-binding protein [Rhodospirillaceae bacterium]|nr:amino acid ABC transporter substrate-binding protein [Rhodospirillaceae bacterium]
MASGRGGSSEPWRVGVLFSQSGFSAVIERTQFNGTILAIEEINAAGGIGGRPIEPVVYDPGSDFISFRRYAEHLLGEEQVNVVFGCYTSGSRKAVLPAIERKNALLFYPTLYEGFEYSPNVIYTGAAPNQNSVQLAQYMMENHGKRFFLVGSNYVYPYESNRIMSDLVTEQGGKVVAERYVRLNSEPADFDRIIAEIAETRPEVIFSTVVGQSTAQFYKAYRAAGFEPETMPIASLTTCEAEVADMGVAAARGHVTAAPYFETVDSDANRAFVARYRERFGAGEHTNMCCEAAYFQVYLFARALAATNALDAQSLREALLGIEFQAPQGPVRIDPDNHHTYLWPRIGRIDGNGAFEIVREASAWVKPDPYLVTHTLDDWSSAVGQVAI